jgi:type IX secretion system PorP/SprF family membrane protein
MKKSVVILLMSILASSLYAKQDPMYTHYMYNTLGINPAYAGSRDAWTATLLHRSQWVGIDGAPTTQTLTVHGPIGSGEAVNLGVSIVNDNVGPLSNPSVFIDYAYRFKLTEKSKLALGLKAGGQYLSFDNDFPNINPNDPSLPEVNGTIKFNVGVGAYFSMDRFYAGISIPQIIENNYTSEETGTTVNIVNEARHYYLIAGAKFDLNKDFALKPTTFLKVTQDQPLQLDLTACAIYKNRFLLGAMFRTGDAIGGLLGVNIIEQLYLGYSLDWSINSEISKNTYASHELVLRYDFASNSQKGTKRVSGPRKFYF